MPLPYIIFFDTIPDNIIREQFFDIIRSNFVSIRAHSNSFIIKSDDGKQPKEIFNLIESKLKKEDGIRFLVISFGSYYGDSLYAPTLEWMKENFPNFDVIA